MPDGGFQRAAAVPLPPPPVPPSLARRFAGPAVPPSRFTLRPLCRSSGRLTCRRR
jgi:hypothetical protein